MREEKVMMCNTRVAHFYCSAKSAVTGFQNSGGTGRIKRAPAAEIKISVTLSATVSLYLGEMIR